MERMINACLIWSLKSQSFLSKKQCDFRKNHSTLDHLVRFETFIRNAFVKKEHILTIFFDLEKTQHGSMAFLLPSGILVSEAISPVLFKVSYLTALLRLEWVQLCMSREWGSHKVVSCPQPCSALRLTTSLKLSWRVRIASCPQPCSEFRLTTSIKLSWRVRISPCL